LNKKVEDAKAQREQSESETNSKLNARVDELEQELKNLKDQTQKEAEKMKKKDAQ